MRDTARLTGAKGLKTVLSAVAPAKWALWHRETLGQGLQIPQASKFRRLALDLVILVAPLTRA